VCPTAVQHAAAVYDAYKAFCLANGEELETKIACCSARVDGNFVCFYEEVSEESPLKPFLNGNTKSCLECKLGLHLWNGFYRVGRASPLTMEVFAVYNWLIKNGPWVPVLAKESNGEYIMVCWL